MLVQTCAFEAGPHAREDSTEVLAGPIRGILAYHPGPSGNPGREGESTYAESAQDRDGGAGKGSADRDGCRSGDFGRAGRMESEHQEAQRSEVTHWKERKHYSGAHPLST